MNKLLKSIYDIEYCNLPNNQEQLREAQDQTGKEEHA